MGFSIPRAFLFTFGVLVLAIVGCRMGTSPTNFANHGPLAERAAKADKIVLYEGLPHQTIESTLLKEELKSKKTVELHDFPFYADPLPISKHDGEKLTALFTDTNSFSPFVAEKRRGGFHPDYCIEWHVGHELYRCLVCFGCHEIKAYGPEQMVRCDIQNHAYEQFERVLKPHRKQRPRPVLWEDP